MSRHPDGSAFASERVVVFGWLGFDRAHMAADKRDQARVSLEGVVRGEVMVFRPMMVLDLSPGGAQIETAFPLQLGSLHDFRLSLADRSVIVKGRIAHCHLGELTEAVAVYRTGLEFVALSGHAQAAITDFLLAISHARAAGPPVLDGIITRKN